MVYDTDNIPNNGNEKNLVRELQNKGYDVTLVNFPNGADYIERNAMALVALLQRENAKLAANGSSEKISIIGPSMGGLVSRYALAYMEKNNIPHNTKLWVSFDSPHLGANIPLAAQETLYFYGYKGKQDKAKIKFDENFRSPAARQMLIEQLDYKQENAPYPSDLMPNGTITSGQNNNTSFRQKFTNNLISNGVTNSSGFPQNLRKIAVINGTTLGTKTNLESQLFLELAAFKIVKYGQIFGTPIQTKINVARIEERFLSTPNSSVQTFYGKNTNLSAFPNIFLSQTVTRSNPNLRGSMDIVPGGMFNTQGIIKDEFDSALNDAIPGRRSIEWRTYVPNHAFIPTMSSLAFKNPNFDWSTPLNRNLICDSNNKEIPFDSYFAPAVSEDHVFVSGNMVNWLMKEIDGNPQLPHFPIQENALQGPSSVCENSNTNYTFGDICKIPSEAIWSVSGNLELVSYTPLSLIVKGTGNGIGVITATFQNGQVFQKEIWVGAPVFKYFNFTNNTGLSYCLGPTDQLKMDLPTDKVIANFDGMSNLEIFNNNNWQWQVNNNLIMLNSSNDKNTRTICPLGSGITSFKVRAKNQCGWSEWYEIPEFEITRLNPNWFFKQSSNIFIIYPNPSDDIVNITLKDIDRKDNIVNEINAELFDIIGSSKTKFKIINNNATFSVKGLNKGIYTLKIYLNNEIETHQISVK